MEYRPLGRTGISVSQLCLGAMMFGAFGNPDHDDVDHDRPPCPRRRDQLHRHRRRLLLRGVGGDRRPGAGRRPARRRRPRHQGRPAVRPRTRTSAARRGGGSPRRSRARCAGSAPTGSTSTRSTASIRPPTSTRPWARCLTWSTRGKIRAFGASNVPASQIVEAQWIAERRGRERFRTEQPPYSLLARAIEHDVLPTCLRYGMGVLVYSPLAGGWLSGRYRKGARISGPTSAARAQLFPGVYDSDQPGQRGQARRRRRPRRARRPGRADPGPDGDRVRHPAPGGHRRDRRPAHDGSPGVLPGRRRRRADRRRPRPDRRDRAARATVNIADNMWRTASLDPASRRR